MDVRDLLILSDEIGSVSDEVRHSARLHEGEHGKLLSDVARMLAVLESSFEARAMGETASFETDDLDRIEFKVAYLLQQESIRAGAAASLFRVKAIVDKLRKFI